MEIIYWYLLIKEKSFGAFMTDLCKAFDCLLHNLFLDNAHTRKFSIKDFPNKCDQIRRKLRVRSHLLKKILMENFIFCAVWKIACLWV